MSPPRPRPTTPISLKQFEPELEKEWEGAQNKRNVTTFISELESKKRKKKPTRVRPPPRQDIRDNIPNP